MAEGGYKYQSEHSEESEDEQEQREDDESGVARFQGHGVPYLSAEFQLDDGEDVGHQSILGAQVLGPVRHCHYHCPPGPALPWPVLPAFSLGGSVGPSVGRSACLPVPPASPLPRLLPSLLPVQENQNRELEEMEEENQQSMEDEVMPLPGFLPACLPASLAFLASLTSLVLVLCSLLPARTGTRSVPRRTGIRRRTRKWRMRSCPWRMRSCPYIPCLACCPPSCPCFVSLPYSPCHSPCSLSRRTWIWRRRRRICRRRKSS